MIHRINIFLICLFVALNPVFLINSANAATVGGWTVNNIAAKGAKAVVSASQNVMINGKEYIKKGTALVAPTASQVSKVLARGAAGYALSVAVEQLLGAVDWVLDPANNQIKYKVPVCSNGEQCGQYVWINTSLGSSIYFNSAESACRGLANIVGFEKYQYKRLENGNTCIYTFGSDNSDIRKATVSQLLNPDAVDEEEKTIPLDVVASKVISNAESGNTDAQTATVAAAQDIVNDAEKDDAKAAPIVNQLENSATTENADAAEQDAANSATGQTKPNTEGGTDLALEFPAFCGWAPTVCQAAQVVINFPQKLENWWDKSVKSLSEAYTYAKDQVQAVRDYFKEETPPEKDTTVVVDELPITPPVSNYFSWNAYCPFQNESSQISINDQTSSVDSDLSSWCTMASEVKPFVIAAGSIASLMIISGVGIKED